LEVFSNLNDSMIPLFLMDETEQGIVL